MNDSLNLAYDRNSPVHSAIGTPSHKNVLRLLVGTRFQVLFHSPHGVLFTFPSRYWFTIGHQGVFSLARWSWRLPTEFLVFRCTQDPVPGGWDFVYGAVTLFGGASQHLQLSYPLSWTVLQPREASFSVWTLPISLAATLGIEISFCSCGY